jgi:predicted DsbA family dithiol-disulfide isomerase
MIWLGAVGGQAQNDAMMEPKKNPLLCDPQVGMCELPGTDNARTQADTALAPQKTVRIVYFTDPICSSCWGIEPQLRKLKLEYGHDVEIDYHMGGLLPDWSYNSGGISKPSDVAHHWDEVSQYYNMPIDGDVWLEDPLDSSYPPSIAFKAAQMQDAHKAVGFLRTLRELLFLQKKNITRWEHVAAAAQSAGLDTAQLRKDVDGEAGDLFKADLQLARQMGVRGFPTLFFTNSAGDTEILYGFKPYAQLEEKMRKVGPDVVAHACARDWQSLFSHYPTLTLREFAELADVPLPDAQRLLDELVAARQLSVIMCKNGSLWVRQR